jgi:chromosome segregation protein
MRLKSLELVGFKSFFEPTTISFASGITAVVGPNGCGKSNVVDAIRWILGEQAPTRLRGKTTEDLVYAGNDQNPAAGMAEVSLVLEAEDGGPLPEQYAALSELAVTRRVYRSGDSEYLINKIPCRLKDITEFFMAAQIHSRGYSLIEQGKIEEIIQAKPYELRSMIEEAAGLSLFKGRREICERKLERVKENLSRVNDVLSEIERQLSYARRQAKKAEQYKIIRAELLELEKLTAARRLLVERDTLGAETMRAEQLATSIENSRQGASTAQKLMESAATDAQSLRGELAAAERELENLVAGAAQRERTRAFLTRKLHDLSESEPAIIARLAELESRATLARAARAEAGARHARATAAGESGHEAALADLTEQLRVAEKDLKETDTKAENLKDDLADIVREAAVVRGRLGDLAGERAELEEKLAAFNSGNGGALKLHVLASNAHALLSAVEQRLERCHGELSALEANERRGAEAEIEARAALEHLAQRLASLRSQVAARNETLPSEPTSEKNQRLTAVLESMNGDRPRTPPAWLHEVLNAPAELAVALRAVLGGELESVVVDSPAFALRAIEILKRDQGGRLSFVPEPDVTATPHSAIEAPGVSGRLLDMINVESRFRAVAEAMLGHVLVADDLNSAMAASNLNGRGTLFVTRDGDLLNPGRMIAGGSLTQNAAAQGGDAMASATASRELASAEDEHRAAAERLAHCQSAREVAAKALTAARARVNECEHEVAQRRGAVAQADQDSALAEAEAANARRRLAEILEGVSGGNARLGELATTEQDSRARLGVMRDELVACRARTDRLMTAVAEAAARVDARKSELAALERDLRHAVETVTQIDAQVAEQGANLERSRTERVDFERELNTLAEQHEAARIRETELSASVERLRMECSECEFNLEGKREHLKTAREELQRLEGEARGCELARERARTLSEELARSFREKFEADFDSVAAEIIPGLEGRDPAQDDARLLELRAKTERIGEVNLAADSEVKELEERAALLGKERADLDAAVQDLTKTISHLNREARKRFAETFQGAAKNFEELFPKLMRGGKGRLELSEATDVLDAGVNIMVQPAGKKVKEIGLLSGGEKALSAMALVFSLFLLNPSPFCVMDEVDAPLDEFSLARFTDLLGELKDRSQFIVITHNQRTMQRADQIHGVTMDRPGISKVISLRIPEAA